MFYWTRATLPDILVEVGCLRHGGGSSVSLSGELLSEELLSEVGGEVVADNKGEREMMMVLVFSDTVIILGCKDGDSLMVLLLKEMVIKFGSILSTLSCGTCRFLEGPLISSSFVSLALSFWRRRR